MAHNLIVNYGLDKKMEVLVRQGTSCGKPLSIVRDEERWTRAREAHALRPLSCLTAPETVHAF